jgi:hypothetical protein
VRTAVAVKPCLLFDGPRRIVLEREKRLVCKAPVPFVMARIASIRRVERG